MRDRGIEPLPGVVGLLRMLRDPGVPCAVASSTHRENIETVFDAIGVREYFVAAVTAEDVSRGKPDPEVFFKSAARIGRDPRHCVIFEDAHVGVEAGLTKSVGNVDVGVNGIKDLLIGSRAH